MGLAGNTAPRFEPELSGARARGGRGQEPSLGSSYAVDWDLWDSLLSGNQPAPVRASLIPEGKRAAYLSALISVLPPGTMYTRPTRGGQLWRGRFTQEQRLSVINLLGALRDRRAAGPLTQQLNDPSNHIRIAIIMALGWIGSPVAVDGLVRMLGHAHEPTRAEAARWLGWIGDARASDALARSLDDPAASVRTTVARALARLDDPRAFGPLMEAFWHCTGQEHDHVLSELRRYDLERTVRVLIQARALEESVRYEVATRALRALGTPAALAALEGYEHRARATWDLDDLRA